MKNHRSGRGLRPPIFSVTVFLKCYLHAVNMLFGVYKSVVSSTLRVGQPYLLSDKVTQTTSEMTKCQESGKSWCLITYNTIPHWNGFCKANSSKNWSTVWVWLQGRARLPSYLRFSRSVCWHLGKCVKVDYRKISKKLAQRRWNGFSFEDGEGISWVWLMSLGESIMYQDTTCERMWSL